MQNEVNEADKRGGLRNFAKAAAFLVLIALLVMFLFALFSPTLDTETRRGVEGIGKQKENSSEAAAGLSDAAREGFDALGFSGLADLSENQSYVGVVDGGFLLCQKSSEDGKKVEVSGSYKDGKTIYSKTNMQAGSRINDPFVVSSIGKDGGAAAVISINGEEKFENGQGVNFVVYNRETGVLLDTSSFSTHNGSKRTSDLLSEAS